MVDYEDIEEESAELSLTWKMATNNRIKAAKATAQDKQLGFAYLMCSDKHRFRKLVEDMDNAFLVGLDEYPKLVNDAYYHICNWSNDPKNHITMGSTNNGLSFAQATTGANVSSGGKEIKRQVNCSVSQMQEIRTLFI